jgi:hypothetical protein
VKENRLFLPEMRPNCFLQIVTLTAQHHGSFQIGPQLVRGSIAFLFLILVGISAPAAPALAPPETSFSTLQYKTGGNGYMDLEGQIWITGTLVGRWITPVDETEANYLQLTLIPDAEMTTRMPSYEGYVTNVIFLNNEASALKSGFQPSASRALLSRKVLRIEQRGEFLLEGVSVSIDCGAQSALANLILIKPETKSAKIALVKADACGYSDSVGG